MKKTIFLIFLLILLCLSGCAADSTQDTDRLQIVAVTFPPYDFARAVVGEYADVSLLIDPGTETHSYDPSPSDVRKIQSCDIFLYGGGESDEWVRNILQSIPNSESITVLSMMEIVPLLEEVMVDGMEAEDHAQDDHAEYDEHVWTDPENAACIVEAIRDAVMTADPDHAEIYRKQGTDYAAEIRALDADFRTIIDHAARHTVIFADRFPFLYFAHAYSLEYYAAFPGCAENTEPGAQTVAFLIEKVTEEQIPAVFTIELSNEQLADTICEATGAEKLLLHSCQNVSKSEFESGITYVALMRQNLENLRKALN